MMTSYRTEINPTEEQSGKIRNTIGACRFVQNLYIATNEERHKKGDNDINAYDFSKWLNNDYLPNHPEKRFVKDVSSKSIKQAILNVESGYKSWRKGKSKRPRLRRKGLNDPKMYFVRNGDAQPIRCERHRIKIPTLGWVRLKEYGYIPTNVPIISGAVSIRAGKFFVSVLVDANDAKNNDAHVGCVGIDLGIKEFATVSNGKVYGNINKTKEVRRLEKKLRREQKRLSRKYGNLKKIKKQNKEGEPTRQNIQKQKLKVQRLYYRLDCIRTDYINKVIAETVKAKPKYITIEDLNVRGMMKNRHLSKAVACQKFYKFRQKLTDKCHKNNIELRLVDRFYPSSKTCHNCGCIKNNLTLKDRTFICECGYREDRDLNAAMNLRDAVKYTTA